MKRAFAALMAAVMGLSLAACGSSSGTDTTTAANGAAATDDGKVVINFFHRWPNDPKNSMFKELVQEYMDENPNVTINMDCILNDQYKEKIGSTPILVDKGQKGRGTASCNLPATRYIIEANPLNVLKPRAFRFAACIMELIPSQTAFVMRW